MLQQHSLPFSKGKWMALDIGQAVIGVALTDTSKSLAFPYGEIAWKSRWGVFGEWMDELLEKESVKKVILGVPMDLQTGKPQDSPVVRLLPKFRAWFEDRGIEVVEQDGAVSTVEASNRLEELRASGVHSGRMDSVAASIILERYIQHNE